MRPANLLCRLRRATAIYTGLRQIPSDIDEVSKPKIANHTNARNDKCWRARRETKCAFKNANNSEVNRVHKTSASCQIQTKFRLAGSRGLKTLNFIHCKRKQQRSSETIGTIALFRRMMNAPCRSRFWSPRSPRRRRPCRRCRLVVAWTTNYRSLDNKIRPGHWSGPNLRAIDSKQTA